MSYLQAFNFSSPFSVTNFGTYGGVPFHSTLTSTATATATHFQQQQNPGAGGGYTSAGATRLPLPESIVPNYNPGATTDYYGNPNQNFANQQAPIPQEYQQQQQPQLQQQQPQLQQQQPQLQQQVPGVASTATLQIPPIGAPTSSSSQTGRGRDNQDGSFDVIIRENDPPAATGGGKRKRVRKPPRVINYSPVYPVHYVPPVGPHTVSLHSEKVSLHDIIDQDAHHQQNPGQAHHQSNILNGNADQSIPSVIPPIPSANNNNNDDDGGDYNNPPGSDLPVRGNNNNLNININSDAQVINSGGIGQGPAGNSAGGDIQQLTNFGGIGGIGSSNPNAPVSNNYNEAPPQTSNSLPPTLPQQGNSQSQQQVPQTQPQAQAPQQQDEQDHDKLRVTPIQGPIYAKDGLVPVVPLYHYNSVKNGTYYQIPILWTALSYALGLEIHGEILRGLPCIKRLNQLYCPSAGQSYPIQKIEGFIDENKALIRRMYGEFIMSSEAYSGPPGGNVLRRSTREIFEDEVPDLFPNKSHKKNKRSAHHHSAHQDHFSLREPPADDHGDFGNRNGTIVNMPSLSSHIRQTRQTVNNRNGSPSQQPRTNRVDSCESTVEIVTPYWAANSGGKVRAIVNTQHFEQAIHQEVCRQTSTRRCSGECGCEQKYKWHRLLAYDPDNDCRGIFMDWFLFPSCCVCRCNPQ